MCPGSERTGESFAKEWGEGLAFLAAVIPQIANCDAEVADLRMALDRHRWRREEVARALGISRVTLWRRMRRCGLAG